MAVDPYTQPTKFKQLPFTTGSGAISNRKKRRVGGRNPRQIGDPNADIDAIFNGIRQNRGMIRRGMSGGMLNPDGSDPDSGWNQFMRNNPHLDTREKRQQQYANEAQQRYDTINQQGRAAVDFMKQTKGYTDANGQFVPPTMPTNSNPNLVTGADGYRTLFDPRNPGKVLGTTAPVKRTVDNAVNRGTASPDEMNAFRQDMQRVGENSASGRPLDYEMSDIDQIFPPQGKKFRKKRGVDGMPSQGNSFPPPSGEAGGGVGLPADSGDLGGGNPFIMPQVNYQFDQQQADFYKPQSAPMSDPFTGQPTRNELTPAQLEVMNLFAPVKPFWAQKDQAMPPAQRPIYGKPQRDNTNAFDVLTSWPFINDQAVESFAQYWPGYDWSLTSGPQANMERIQRNFNDLINKGLLDYQPSGQPRPSYVDSPRAPGAAKMFKPKIIPQTKEEAAIAATRALFNR